MRGPNLTPRECVEKVLAAYAEHMENPSETHENACKAVGRRFRLEPNTVSRVVCGDAR